MKRDKAISLLARYMSSIESFQVSQRLSPLHSVVLRMEASMILNDSL